MPSQKLFDLYVIVYFGYPDDYQKYRHVALFFASRDKQQNYTYHAKLDENKRYMLEVLVGRDSLSSVNIAGTVEVGEVRLTLEELDNLMRQVPIFQDGEVNCQIWAGDAMNALVRGGHLSNELQMKAVDQMVDITMEAMDEP